MQYHAPLEISKGNLTIDGPILVMDHFTGDETLCPVGYEVGIPIAKPERVIQGKLLQDHMYAGLDAGDWIFADVTLEANEHDLIVTVIEGIPALAMWGSGVDALAVVTHSIHRVRMALEDD